MDPRTLSNEQDSAEGQNLNQWIELGVKHAHNDSQHVIIHSSAHSVAFDHDSLFEQIGL